MNYIGEREVGVLIRLIIALQKLLKRQSEINFKLLEDASKIKENLKLHYRRIKSLILNSINNFNALIYEALKITRLINTSTKLMF